MNFRWLVRRFFVTHDAHVNRALNADDIRFLIPVLFLFFFPFPVHLNFSKGKFKYHRVVHNLEPVHSTETCMRKCHWSNKEHVAEKKESIDSHGHRQNITGFISGRIYLNYGWPQWNELRWDFDTLTRYHWHANWISSNSKVWRLSGGTCLVGTTWADVGHSNGN